MEKKSILHTVRYGNFFPTQRFITNVFLRGGPCQNTYGCDEIKWNLL